MLIADSSDSTSIIKWFFGERWYEKPANVSVLIEKKIKIA